MGKERKYAPDAETQIPVEQKLPEYRGTTAPVIMYKQTSTPEIRNVQKEVKAPIKSIVGSLVAGLAISGAALYAYETGYNPFKSEDTKTFPSSLEDSTPPADAMPDMPERIDTPEQLAATLKKFGIKASAKDFEALAKKTGKKNIYLEALTLEAQKNDQPDTATHDEARYIWNALRAQGVVKFQEQDVLIATYVRKPRFVPYVKTLGVQPKAEVTDSDNAMIRYHYYECVPKGKPDIATIAVQDERGRNLTLYPMKLTACENPEQNGVE